MIIKYTYMYMYLSVCIYIKVNKLDAYVCAPILILSLCFMYIVYVFNTVPLFAVAHRDKRAAYGGNICCNCYYHLWVGWVCDCYPCYIVIRATSPYDFVG